MRPTSSTPANPSFLPSFLLLGSQSHAKPFITIPACSTAASHPTLRPLLRKKPLPPPFTFTRTRAADWTSNPPTTRPPSPPSPHVRRRSVFQNGGIATDGRTDGRTERKFTFTAAACNPAPPISPPPPLCVFAASRAEQIADQSAELSTAAVLCRTWQGPGFFCFCFCFSAPPSPS